MKKIVYVDTEFRSFDISLTKEWGIEKQSNGDPARFVYLVTPETLTDYRTHHTAVIVDKTEDYIELEMEIPEEIWSRYTLARLAGKVGEVE